MLGAASAHERRAELMARGWNTDPPLGPGDFWSRSCKTTPLALQYPDKEYTPYIHNTRSSYRQLGYTLITHHSSLSKRNMSCPTSRKIANSANKDRGDTAKLKSL